MKVDAKRLWKHMEKNKVDNIFECMHKALLSLQQKIKDGTATSEECNQALTLVIQLGMTDLLPLAHEDKHMCNLDLSLSAPGKITEDAGDDFSLLEIDEGIYLRAEGDSAETSSQFYQDHECSRKCLSKRPWDSYKGENPLKLPMLCHFQRWHAKATSGSKSHDVLYKAPCGKSLRNFKDVQNYLFQTECSFLFLDHFSFNTYVQVFRSSSSPQAFVMDPDISQGAETVPVSFCNDISHDRLPCFKYRKTSWPHGYLLNNLSGNFLNSCNCTDGCIDRSTVCFLGQNVHACFLLKEPSGKLPCLQEMDHLTVTLIKDWRNLFPAEFMNAASSAAVTRTCARTDWYNTAFNFAYKSSALKRRAGEFAALMTLTRERLFVPMQVN